MLYKSIKNYKGAKYILGNTLKEIDAYTYNKCSFSIITKETRYLILSMISNTWFWPMYLCATGNISVGLW